MNWKEKFKQNLLEVLFRDQPRHPKGSPQGGQWMSTDSTTASWENKSKGELRVALMGLGVHSISSGPEASMAGITSDDMGNKIGSHMTEVYKSRPELKEFVNKLTEGHETDSGTQLPGVEKPAVFIKGNKEELGGGIIASFNPTQNQINMPGGIKSDPNELNIGQEQYNVGTKLETAFRHEYGHFISQYTPNWLEWTDNVHDKIGGKQTFKEKVSFYAGKDYDEAFAESFAAWSHPKYKQANNKLPKEVEQYFDNLFKQNPKIRN
jgi:hypothetical protein